MSNKNNFIVATSNLYQLHLIGCIQKIREAKEWSQEQVAQKLNMLLNSYAKIERGEIKLYLNKLEQITQILDIDIVYLIQSGEKNICFQIESPLGISRCR